MNDAKSADGFLTTHVLDTMSGQPAQGVRITLRSTEQLNAPLLADTVTNTDGRCDAPLLEGESFRAGGYQLEFHAGDYFRANNVDLGEPAFLDVVPLRFGISDPTSHYHVPLLISPYAFSTYRGS